ncbi:DMT family transporter [Ponticoccus sp. SC2-23]|uniref:DMT family transporter n=1 Tax=Alexandriicola marinus TaxID=2081710 RepID=UPI000FDA17BE|nr:DMT family transporter [Alexandriicola marinus]MBM1220632.1 DMT family transporter [Ponticoccus sp. SC6-9]MBM1225318.1 DMT family transporter [Ponticoccus sp. SC6-15]MBM1228832.1 DMT family transporter [Ponticoccus sp. SC6-38]MBM1233531.1 DMT family transporter [Ponticoccus sp. SC6-45]MBM1239333.1 DMT family transporter [Ponticoccus sp. SC6-49]MBM1243115.1 DMT family transporter [Ponticoccus sp. SC2-64]MBM1247055.1 DMT family transporter [Ponticoccus sp. SC6-42]MBM1252286.1 DMT family tr
MQPLRGIAFKIVSVCIFVAMVSLIKATSEHVPPGQAVFFRSLFAIPVILVWLAARRELGSGLKTDNPMGHLWRGLIGTTSMGLGFAGLGLLPLPEVTAIGYAAPLLVVVFAAMFLNENVRLFRLSAVALGMIGVMIVLSPRLSVGADLNTAETLGAVVVLGSAIFAALAQVFVRKLVRTEGTAAIVFWFSVTATCMSLLTIFWGWVWPSPREAGLLILAGVLGGIGQILLTTSYRHADASLIAPFEYTSMLLALGVGYLVFDEVPTLTMIIGAAIIIVAGVSIILRERHLGLERARQRKAMPPSNG